MSKLGVGDAQRIHVHLKYPLETHCGLLRIPQPLQRYPQASQGGGDSGMGGAIQSFVYLQCIIELYQRLPEFPQIVKHPSDAFEIL